MLIFGKAHSGTQILPSKFISYAPRIRGAPGALPVGLIQMMRCLFSRPSITENWRPRPDPHPSLTEAFRLSHKASTSLYFSEAAVVCVLPSPFVFFKFLLEISILLGFLSASFGFLCWLSTKTRVFQVWGAAQSPAVCPSLREISIDWHS